MARLSALLLLLGLCACGPTIRSDVTVFHDLPSAGAAIRYAAVPFKEQVGSLEHETYARLVKDKLAQRGFIEVPLTEAELLLFISYDIDGGREVISSYPIIGRTGVAYSYTSGVVDSRGGFSAETTSIPSYGVVGARTRSDTAYTRSLRIELLERTDLENGGIRKRYEAKVVSSGSSSQLAAVLPTMVEALFEDFPGRSGAARTSTIPAPSR